MSDLLIIPLIVACVLGLAVGASLIIVALFPPGDKR